MANVSATCKMVRPMMSRDVDEARRRVICLYRSFYRYIPYIVKHFDVEKSEQDCRLKLRELFLRNACVKDVRVIDLLVMKGFMELAEVKYQWMQKGHIMAKWNPTHEPQPTDFVGKFLYGVD